MCLCIRAMVRAIAFVHKQQCEMRCEEGTTGWPSMGQVGWVRVSHVTDHWLRSELGVGSRELGVGSQATACIGWREATTVVNGKSSRS